MGLSQSHETFLVGTAVVVRHKFQYIVVETVRPGHAGPREI